MARFRLAIPGHRKTVIIYGHNSGGCGFFATVIRAGKRIVEYDTLHDGYDGLPGLLNALVRAAVFTQEDAAEAVRLLPIVDDLTDIEDAAVRLIAEVIQNLKAAAAE